MRRRARAAALIRRRAVLTATVLTLAAVVHAGPSEPAAVVTRLNDVLLGVLKQADTLGYQGRVARLTPAVSEAYDVPFMAEKSLGAGWKSLSEADRQQWLALSREFSVANYAANFDHYSGQTVELLGEEPAANETTMVRTRIVDPKGEPIEMTYRLHKTAAGWQIIDVYLKGTVSELALRRADYSAVLQREGFAGLVRTMKARIAELAAGTAARQGN